VDPDHDVGLALRPSRDATLLRPHRGRRDVSGRRTGGQLRTFSTRGGDVGEVETGHEVEHRSDLRIDPTSPGLRLAGHEPSRRPGVNVVGIRWNPALTP
jgi:hypothetical protein